MLIPFSLYTIFPPTTTDVVVGFEQTQITVFENVGQVEVCLSVTAPADISVPFPGIYDVGIETVADTAGN